MKRFFDIVASLLLLILLSPVFFIVFILVRVYNGAPALFAQERPGLDGRTFTIYKIRTMKDIKNSSGEPLPDRERLTGFGRFLRSTSLDELPELINVLKGDMSLVGPRPLLIEYLSLYSEDQARRHEVKPGITGWAQVNGRNAISWEDKFRLDVWYVDNRSFLLDLKILFMTFIRVFTREGISQEGSETMEKFRGTENKIERQI